MDLLADQIRKVHKICQEREDEPIEESYQRPRWARWFRTIPALLVGGFILAIVAILSQVKIQSLLQAQLEIWGLRVVAGIWVVYTAVGSVLQVRSIWMELRELKEPFSKEDSKNVEAGLKFDQALAQIDPIALDLAASWLEVRSKKIENTRAFLMGLSTLSSGVVGLLLWPGSPLKAQLADRISLGWIIALQFWCLCLLIGAVLAIGAGWNRGIRSTNRALTIRRVLANRDLYLRLDSTASIEKAP